MGSRTKKTVAVVCLLLVGTIFTVAMTGVLAGPEAVAINEDVPDDEIARIQKIIDKINDEKISKVISDSEITKPIEILPSGRYKATILLEDSSFKDINEFGHYHPPPPCGRALFRLFDGHHGPGYSVIFNAEYKFGLWLNAPVWRLGGLWYSERKLNVDNFTHILIYKLEYPYYLVMVEDLCQGGDEDYDDMVVLLEQLPTPTVTVTANPMDS